MLNRMCEWSFLSLSQCVGADELLRHNVISSDGISCESGNTSEYEQRDKHAPQASTSVSPYRKRAGNESFRATGVTEYGAHSFKEKGQKKQGL